MGQNYTQLNKMTKLTALARLTSGLIFLLFFTGSLIAQVSTLQLSTNTNTSKFSVLNSSSSELFTVFGDGTVGIQQTSPNATLEVGGLNGLLVTGTYGHGTALNLGAGTRMHWYPKKAAFRVGYVDGTQWNNANVGNYSFASGYNTTASGYYSTAMGYKTTASAFYSTAMGGNTTASQNYSTAMGYNTTASGYYSTAMGFRVSTNGKSGSFIIGDGSSSKVDTSTASNQMMMRFAGGYKLYSNYLLSTGVYMNGGVSGWTNISDRNKKENFRPLNGELLLEKISAMPITEWNYKGTDKSIRYIGPMAQDFYAAFHLGGTDSLGINSIAIDGVNMAAIQALIKRTDELRIANEELRIAQQKLKNKTAELVKLKDTVKDMQKDFSQIKRAFAIFINNGSPNVKSRLTMNK